jgi:hypothetical protein
LAHVAKTAGELGEPLAIGALSEPAHLQMIGLQKDWARDESQYRFRIVQESLWRKKTAI